MVVAVLSPDRTIADRVVSAGANRSGSNLLGEGTYLTLNDLVDCSDALGMILM